MNYGGVDHISPREVVTMPWLGSKKNDEEAFETIWDYLALSPRDDDNGQLIFCSFSWIYFSPRLILQGRNTVVSGRLEKLRLFGHMVKMDLGQRLKNGGSTRKKADKNDETMSKRDMVYP